MTDVGINDQFVKGCRSNLTLLIRKMTADKVLADLQGVGGTVLHTSFDHTKEEALRQSLAGATATNPAGGNA